MKRLTEEKQKFMPGSGVFVVERDEYGEFDMAGYMFVAQVGNYAIVTAYISGIESLIETMEYHKNDTAENDHCDLSVFPLEDCYVERAEAEAALKEEPTDDTIR